MPSSKLVIVGGGPAGMMAGLLFARAGVETLVLEKHGDFLRDFRGDTVHPSTIALFDELGLGDALLAREHDMVTDISAVVGGKAYRVADLTHLPVRHKFMLMMPQWHFLDFVRDEASKWPGFSLRMEAEVIDIQQDGDRITGVVLKGGEVIAADLIIAADGRASTLQAAIGWQRDDLGAPIDVFWFRVPKQRTVHNETMGRFTPGTVIAMIDRGDYWQCAFVFAKGGAETIRALGIAAFRERIALSVPEIAGSLDALASWDDVKLLSVSLDRLSRWHRPGLLFAHAMSPVGGVGINLAIQDAVAAANILAAAMARGGNIDELLGEVRDRRIFPIRVIQGMQRAVHGAILGPVLSATAQMKTPFALRMLDRFPVLQRIPARIVGLGVRREHIRSPETPRTGG